MTLTRMRRVLVAGAAWCCLAAAAPPVVRAQTAMPEPGDRVRVTVPCTDRTQPGIAPAWCSHVGAFRAIRADTLTIELRGSTAHWDLGSVNRFELGRGDRSYRLAGAIAGLVAGTGTTYIVLCSGGSTSPCDRSANQDAMSARECLGLTALGGLAGAALGAMIGSLVRSERWQMVTLDRLRIGLPWTGRGGPILSIAL
jgi:hypothetical protein